MTEERLLRANEIKRELTFVRQLLIDMSDKAKCQDVCINTWHPQGAGLNAYVAEHKLPKELTTAIRGALLLHQAALEKEFERL